MTIADEIRELRSLAEWDWLITNRGNVLHHPHSGDPNPDVMGYHDVQFSCGRTSRWAWIPGVFTRMGAKRCDRCCDRLGYPRGKGSPKNDDACRPLVERRVKA